jgi:tRNA pseudouridine13 synthase
MKIFPTDYQYLNGCPSSSALIRCENSDFQVNEIPAFEPDGEGEHWYFKIEKEGENSDWIAKQLAIFFNVSSKEIGYAGKKDRHAITQQWFSVCLPGVKTVDVSAFETESVRILAIEKHSRKLRTGALKGNCFKIRLKNVTDDTDIEKRLALISSGVPNYFGEQRFGIDGGNLRRGIALLKGEFKERNRTKKGLYISAVRSWLFNHMLSNRLKDNLWLEVMEGDVVMLDGTKSHFVSDDVIAIKQRIKELDLHLTGALWGRGRSITEQQAAVWEQAQVSDFEEVTSGLEKAGLSQERRAIRVLPKNLQYIKEDTGVWLISFDLPPGAFATSVLRELCNISSHAGGKR